MQSGRAEVLHYLAENIQDGYLTDDEYAAEAIQDLFKYYHKNGKIDWEDEKLSKHKDIIRYAKINFPVIEDAFQKTLKTVQKIKDRHYGLKHNSEENPIRQASR